MAQPGGSSWPRAGSRGWPRGISAWPGRDSASCATDTSLRRYLRIHGNEETARQVLERHMETHEGIAYVIESRTRVVAVESLKLDPNRLFSRVGAEANLNLLNPGVAPEPVRSRYPTAPRSCWWRRRIRARSRRAHWRMAAPIRM